MFWRRRREIPENELAPGMVWDDTEWPGAIPPGDDYTSGLEYTQNQFREQSNVEYWRYRPLLELEIEIRRLENENNTESHNMAQRLRVIKNELHDEHRARMSLRRPSPGTARRVRSGPSLPPSAISGTITGGNFPRTPTVADIHRGFSQMTPRTQQLLEERHEIAKRERGYPRAIRSEQIDRDVDRMRRYDFGLPRETYRPGMIRGEGLDFDKYRTDMPHMLSTRFRDLNIKSQKDRQRDSHFTRLASLEVWKQRQLDKKYHPRPPIQQPRQHVFGPQEPRLRTEWKEEAKKVMPFAMVESHFGEPIERPVRSPRLDRSRSSHISSVPDIPESSGFQRFTSKFRKPAVPSTPGRAEPISRERSWSRSGPDLFGEQSAGPSTDRTAEYFSRINIPKAPHRAPLESIQGIRERPPRPPYKAGRPSASQRLANRYVREARSQPQYPRQQRQQMREEARPFRADEESLGFDMSENAPTWHLDPWHSYRHMRREPL